MVKRLYALLLLTALPIVAGQADIGFDGIGGNIGFVKPFRTPPAFGMGAQCDLGTIVPNLHPYPSFDLWFTRDNHTHISYLDNYGYIELAFNADVRYYFPIPSGKVNPYGGAGLALSFTFENERWDPVHDLLNETNTTVRPGLNFFAGADFAISSTLSFFAETRLKVSSYSLFRLGCGLTWHLNGKIR